MLEAVARERMVKTSQAGKGLAVAVVIYELWILAVALYLLVFTSTINIKEQLSLCLTKRHNMKAYGLLYT
jgi:hypothetical protein